MVWHFICALVCVLAAAFPIHSPINGLGKTEDGSSVWVAATYWGDLEHFSLKQASLCSHLRVNQTQALWHY